jgi:hypothetical protein
MASSDIPAGQRVTLRTAREISDNRIWEWLNITFEHSGQPLISIPIVHVLVQDGLGKWWFSNAVMKAEMRMSIKDYRRNKNLKILLVWPPFRAGSA